GRRGAARVGRRPAGRARRTGRSGTFGTRRRQSGRACRWPPHHRGDGSRLEHHPSQARDRGDVEEGESLGEPVRRAHALVIEATFPKRDATLARSRGHLTAAAAAQLAGEAEIGELLLTHISGRYKAEEILAEAAGVFPRVRVAADFDRISVTPRVSS